MVELISVSATFVSTFCHFVSTAVYFKRLLSQLSLGISVFCLNWLFQLLLSQHLFVSTTFCLSCILSQLFVTTVFYLKCLLSQLSFVITVSTVFRLNCLLSYLAFSTDFVSAFFCSYYFLSQLYSALTFCHNCLIPQMSFV